MALQFDIKIPSRNDFLEQTEPADTNFFSRSVTGSKASSGRSRVSWAVISDGGPLSKTKVKQSNKPKEVSPKDPIKKKVPILKKVISKIESILPPRRAKNIAKQSIYNDSNVIDSDIEQQKTLFDKALGQDLTIHSVNVIFRT